MKKVIGLLVALCVMFGVTTNTAITVNAETFGPLTYEVVNGEVTITDCEEDVTGVLSIPEAIYGMNVTAVKASAFHGCDEITKIILPKYIKSFSGLSVPDNDGLTAIEVVDDNAYFTDVNGVLFNKAKTAVVYYPRGLKATTYTVSNGVQVIRPYAFGNMTIQTVKLPASLTTISEHAFRGCQGMTSITIPSSVRTIGDSAFESCILLKNIVIPEGVQTIGAYAFSFTSGQKTLIIPSTVTAIGEEAFYDCWHVKTVLIPENVKFIGDKAFNYVQDTEGEDYLFAGVTIVGKKGSTAEKYAKNNSAEFVSFTTKMSLSSVAKYKGAFKAKWKKNSTATGYQIRYSLKSNMSGSKTVTITKYKTTSKKVSKLKKKTTYYVQIRPYKTVNGAKLYGSWSATKKVKTK